MPDRLDEHLQDLYDLIENQRGQLVLAWTVLVALGFEISEAFDIM